MGRSSHLGSQYHLAEQLPAEVYGPFTNEELLGEQGEIVNVL